MNKKYKYLLAVCLLVPGFVYAAEVPSPRSMLIPEISGYIQPQIRVQRNTGFSKEDQDRFSINLARIVVRDSFSLGATWGSALYNLEVDFSRGAPIVKDVLAAWQYSESLGINLGQFKTPLGYMVNISERNLSMIDQPMLIQMGYGRDIGGMLAGQALAGSPDSVLYYAAGMFDGEGIGVQRNSNESFRFAARTLWAPLGPMPTHQSDLRKEGHNDLRFAFGGSAGYDPNSGSGELFETNRRDLRWLAEFHLWWRGFSLHAEGGRGYVWGKKNGDFQFARKGYYAQAAYRLAGLRWLEFAYRNEWFDYHEGYAQNRDELQSRMINTAGINVYLHGNNMELQINYILTDLTEGVATSPQGDPLYGDTVQARLQVGF